jgi:uncharacterized protein (DUF58 family)
MNRTSTTTLLALSTLTGVIAFALTAATGTGAGGAYAFALIGLLVLAIFLLWPDVRERFSNGRHPHSRPSNERRRPAPPGHGPAGSS